jgi:dTDP-glucose 4,6-dehydratase
LRVAVLGSNSFAGCDFVDLLLEVGDYEILGISRSPEKPREFLPYARRARDRFVYRQLDLNVDFDEVRVELDSFEPQHVVNFAAQGDDEASWAHPQDFFETNCVALARLIDHLKSRPYLRRFLQVSSSGVYGNAPRALTEETSPEPRSPYGVSKTAADLLLLAYHANAGFPAQILRPPNLYGPYQQLFRIVPKSIILLKRGESIELHGGGQAVRSYLHVRDASRAVLTILERGGTGEIYNVAPDQRYRIREIVAMICERLGKDFDASTREVGDRQGQTSGQDVSSVKIRRDLGWHPQVSLQAGIADVCDWIDREWNELVDQRLLYKHKR